jgi:hypothetical protein
MPSYGNARGGCTSLRPVVPVIRVFKTATAAEFNTVSASKLGDYVCILESQHSRYKVKLNKKGVWVLRPEFGSIIKTDPQRWTPKDKRPGAGTRASYKDRMQVVRRRNENDPSIINGTWTIPAVIKAG